VPSHQVVVVDDDDLVLETLRRMLTRWGYQVVAFNSFEDARSYLAQGLPSALVTDVRLGTYNGLQLIHLARQTSPHTGLIAISGFDDAVLRAEAERAGAAFLIKPLDSTMLRSLLPHPTAALADIADLVGE
jgi:FixJ family two-component response regulator